MRRPRTRGPGVPRIHFHNQWKGETAVLIASGPSLSEQDVSAVRGKARCLTINDNWRLAPWADALYAADHNWWHHYRYVHEFTGQKWTVAAHWCDGEAEAHGINVLQARDEPGLSRDPGVVNVGLVGNSGFQALNLAVHFGVSRIILLGYDLNDSGDSHWFGDHPRGLVNTGLSKNAGRRKGFEAAVPDLEDMGVEVINCSRETDLTCFPRADLKVVLDG